LYKRYLPRKHSLLRNGVAAGRHLLTSGLKQPESAREPGVRYLGYFRLLYISSDSHRVLLTPHNLSNMSIAFPIWISVIELLVITFSGVFIVVYSIVALFMPDTKTPGVLTVFVRYLHPSITLAASDTFGLISQV